MSPSNPWGHRRICCSRSCGISLGNTKRRARSAEVAEVDEVAVMRLIAGDPVTSTKAERLEAVRALTGRGRSAAWIARQLHMTPRSVQRLRAELHLRNALPPNRKAA
jgi:hypothetical protein